MRAVVQRVTEASVEVDGAIVGAIGAGLLALVSAGQEDGDADAPAMADKIAGLRIFCDDAGKMNLDVGQIGGAVLLVSQFTLHGDARKGKRPSFMAAMAPDRARLQIEAVAQALRERGLPVEQGVFGADMAVRLLNDGPVTILLDTHKHF